MLHAQLIALLLVAPGQDSGLAAHVEHVTELGLTLTFPPELSRVEPFVELEPSPERRAAWSAHVGSLELGVFADAWPREASGAFEPEDVCEELRDEIRKNGDARFAFQRTELVVGPFGYAPYAALGWGPRADEDQKSTGSYFVLGGLGETRGYAIEVECDGVLDETATAVVLGFLRKGVSCACKPRDPLWTSDEVKARWAKDAPPGLAKKLEKPVRTKHYVFLSNTDAAKQMGESMEKFYATIQKLYPFPEVTGRRLLPIFLFRNPEEYCDFFVAAFGSTLEDARKSKGVAGRDFYATYYDAPQDPIHLHEATHQIFANRLRLDGGGSWFQEGVAEYASTAASDRTDASNLVKHGRHVKLPELVRMENLLWSETPADKKSGGAAWSRYSEAALLIEFVRESKWSRAKFLDWIQAIGRCPPNDVEALEGAVKATLGVDLAGFEEKWIEYCKSR